MEKLTVEQFNGTKKVNGKRRNVAETIYNFLFTGENLKLKGAFKLPVSEVLPGLTDIAPWQLTVLDRMVVKNKIAAEIGGVRIGAHTKSGREIVRLSHLTVNYK